MSSNATSFRLSWRNNSLFCFLVAITIFAGGGYLYLKSGSFKRAAGQSLRQLPSAIIDDVSTTDSAASFNESLVLCYHQVRDWRSGDSPGARTYIMPVSAFREQMKLLYDKGYHTVLPGQQSNRHVGGNQKSFILTFDDGTESQYTNALPELDRYGFKAVFFIMTVTLGKPGFMSREQIRLLSDNGHLIGCHTWDHHNVKNYGASDWITQLQRPTQLLEHITGKPVRYFAYPFGSWDSAAIYRLKNQGYAAAFQLAGPADKDNPCFTIRRMLVDGHWPASRFLVELRSFATRNSLQP